MILKKIRNRKFSLALGFSLIVIALLILVYSLFKIFDGLQFALRTERGLPLDIIDGVAGLFISLNIALCSRSLIQEEEKTKNKRLWPYYVLGYFIALMGLFLVLTLS